MNDADHLLLGGDRDPHIRLSPPQRTRHLLFLRKSGSQHNDFYLTWNKTDVSYEDG